MANEQKDRLGDKLKDLDRAREDKFFADREKELLAKLRAKKSGAGSDDETADETSEGGDAGVDGKKPGA